MKMSENLNKTLIYSFMIDVDLHLVTKYCAVKKPDLLINITSINKNIFEENSMVFTENPVLNLKKTTHNFDTILNNKPIQISKC